MDKVTRLRHAQQRILKVQRRLWLAQIAMWPTLVITGVAAVGGVVWLLRRRSAGGRHELPESPGAHRVETVAEHNGQVSQGVSPT
ncbi:hypothetical protein [Mycolicibacterium litorale]|uniref:Uncharacterized protein n=1 Tax=Mycolicibacterium litorale TaxID=758802 RepID=A0AAD1IN27_9MYCO|nr:hypothetical protein [Mycolicibacterium litorale]MCV7417148.1 hypothetical protein [Mycolicibacterium litorale]TDY04936.1 hypothetical protein BCL50_3717 [Mycolicibacterium litorale]BBY18365.1 hypothetical protein MLIT_39570 [Mycolicibacterium litorale]